MQATSLSQVDAKILHSLQENWNRSRQDLADELNMSLSTLRRRIRELEAVGVIDKSVALLDRKKVGLSVCVFVSVNLRSHEKAAGKAFEDWVADEPAIMACYSVTGEYDYSLIVLVSSVEAFERFLMESVLSHPSVSGATSQIALREHKYTTKLPIHAA